MIGGAHAQFDCATAGPKTAQDLIDAGFGVDTVHVKTSGGCNPDDTANGKATFYRVMKHVNVGGGADPDDYRFQLEYCTNGQSGDPGYQTACGEDITDPVTWTCKTTNLTANFYNQGTGTPVTYCLGEAQEKEVQGLAHTTSRCTADPIGACADSAGTTYNCLVSGLEVCAASAAPPPPHNHACGPTTDVKFTGAAGTTAYTITVDGVAATEVSGATDFNVCKDFSIERTFSGSHPLTITDLTSPAISGWSSLGKSTHSGAVGTTYSYVCDSHSQMKGTITVIDCNPCGSDQVCATLGATDFTCTCDTGYSGSTTTNAATTCGDTDECASNPCGSNQVCTGSAAPLTDFTCTCDTGYTGTTTTNAATSCGDPDECASNPCGADQVCTGSAAPGTDFTCACGTGYTGSTTTNAATTCGDTDECASNPCGSNQVCTGSAAPLTDFTCTCDTGYTGTTTTNAATSCGDPDECAGTPCKNGASCADVAAPGTGYTCTCAAGWSGATCETNIDDCASSPCKNGGACADGVNSFTCTCAAGWSGATCLTDIDYCTTSAPTIIYVGEGSYDAANPPHFDFYKDQACTSEKLVLKAGSTDTYTLFANTEYTFKSCSVRSLSYQHPMKVFLEGASVEGDPVLDATYRTIQMGGIGTRAVYKNANSGQFDGYFEAVAFAHGCLNGATCVDGQTSYTCNCTTGWSGPNCDTDIDECAGGTPPGIGACAVANSWKCEESNDDSSIALGDYWCDCTTGWSGPNCDTDIDECAGGIPTGIGACVVTNTNSCEDSSDDGTIVKGAFRCNCKDGYDGQTCADDINECLPNSGRGLCGNADQVQECRESSKYTVAIDTYLCVCKDGWTHDSSTGHCTVDVDECATNQGQGQCANSAPCTESGTLGLTYINDYRCACTAGWKGKDCDVSMDDCLRLISDPSKTCDEAGIAANDPDCANPCKEGSTCTDSHLDYTCACQPGWHTKNCDTSIDDCNPNGQGNPCLHGATCTDKHQSHECKCSVTSPPHYNDPAKNEVNCDTLVVQGCMDPKKFNYDKDANHDDNPANPCTGGFNDWYDQAKNGGVSDRKGRVTKFMEMQDRKAKVSSRPDGKNHGIVADRIVIRKLDRIKIKLDDFKSSVRNKTVFTGKSLKMEVGPVNKDGATDAVTENCVAKAADYKSGDESCITTMLDEEEPDAAEGGKMTLTRRVVPCVGCWQVAGKEINGTATPVFKQTKTHEGGVNDDKYTMSCWDETSKTWEQETTDVKEGDDFQCEKTRHRVIVGGLTNNPAACTGLAPNGCTGEQLSEAYRNRGSDCSGQIADTSFSRSIVAAEANTGDCKTLGCTKEAIESAFTCS